MSDKPKAPKVEFAKNDRERFRDVPLEWPLKVDGEQVDKITVRRLKALEVAALQDQMGGEGVGEFDLLLPFVDQPQAVVEGLDQDDLTALKEAVFDFLPQVVRKTLEAAAAEQGLLTGEPLSETSPTPSSGPNATS